MSGTAANVAALAAGLGEAALALGAPFNRCRPVGTVAPGPVGETIYAAFSRSYSFTLTIDPKKPQRFGMFDFTNTAVGDYFFSSNGAETYFVANMQPLQPVLCIRCNAAVTIRRPSGATIAGTPRPVGAVGYIGNVVAGANTNLDTLVTEWPASVLYSGRGPATESRLPADQTSAQYTILLPISLPVELFTGYVFEDELDRRFVAISAERSEGGWRVIANQAVL